MTVCSVRAFSVLNVYFHYSAVLVQMVQQQPVSVHVWPPLCSFTAYFIAWYIIIIYGGVVDGPI